MRVWIEIPHPEGGLQIIAATPALVREFQASATYYLAPLHYNACDIAGAIECGEREVLRVSWMQALQRL